MSDSPIQLKPSIRRSTLPVLPGQPPESSYGIVYGGIDMPHEGSCYVVRFLTADTVQILAYADEYGRIFETETVERIPPARYPSVCIMNYSDAENMGSVNTVDSDGTIHRVAEMRRDLAGFEFLNARCALPRLPKLDLRSAFAISYLMFRHFPHLNGNDVAALHLADVVRRLNDRKPLDALRSIAEDFRASEQMIGARPLGLVKYLVGQLDDTGLTAESPAALQEGDGFPTETLRIARLAAYSDTYYMDFDAASAPAAATQALLSAESALNRFLALSRWAEENNTAETLTAEQCTATDRWLCDRICTQAPDPAVPEPAEGEWDARLNLARSIEKLRLPFRVDSAFRMDLETGKAALEVICPGSSLMPTAEDAAEGRAATAQDRRNGDAARYAAHVAILMAACAFACSGRVNEVLIDLYRNDPGSDRVRIIAGRCSRAAFEPLFAADPEHAFGDPFAVAAAMGLKIAFGEGYLLMPVESAGSIHDREFCPEARYDAVNKCEGAFRPDIAEKLGVQRVCDLNIFEDHHREELADQVLSALEESTEQGLRAAKDIHDRTENVLLRAVCKQVIEGIEQGQIDATSYLELREAFGDIYGLRTSSMRAAALKDTDPDQAVKIYAELLRTADENRWFTDSASTCYRYFDSYTARVLMALRSDETRRVLPIADEPFLAHDWTAYHLVDSFEAGTEGLKHARACTELAPTMATGYLHTARIFFFTGDFMSEIEECKKAMAVATRRGDLALAYYWMGYAYWKTGRPDLGAICYRRCMAADSTYAENAGDELEELLSENKGIRTLSEEEETRRLAAEGVPVEAARENAEFLMEIARAAADAGSFPLAQILMGAALAHLRDDALYPLFSSFDK